MVIYDEELQMSFRNEAARQKQLKEISEGGALALISPEEAKERIQSIPAQPKGFTYGSTPSPAEKVPMVELKPESARIIGEAEKISKEEGRQLFGKDISGFHFYRDRWYFVEGGQKAAYSPAPSYSPKPKQRIPMSEMQKSQSIGEALLGSMSSQPQKRTMAFGGEFVFHEPKFVEAGGNITMITPYSPTEIKGEVKGMWSEVFDTEGRVWKKVEGGWYEPNVEIMPVSEPEMTERKEQKEINEILKPYRVETTAGLKMVGLEAERRRGYGEEPYSLLPGEKVSQDPLEEFGKGAGFVFFSMPYATAKGLELIITNPEIAGIAATESIKSMLDIKGMAARPALTIGQFVGAAGFAGGLKFGLGKASAIKMASPKFPSGKTAYRGISIEYGEGAKAQPLIGMAEGKIRLGTPEIDLSKETFKGYVPETPTETRIMLKSMKTAYPEKEIMKVKSFVKGSEITAHQPSKFVQDAFSRELKSLSPKQFEEVLRFGKEEKALLYGSKGAETQMPAGRMGRMPADIDIQLELPEDLTIQKTSLLAGRLGKVPGPKIRVSTKHPTLIKSLKEGGDPFKEADWRHAVDVHSIEAPIEDMMSPGIERAFGFRHGQKPVKIEGIDVMPLSEHGIRKGASSSQFREGRIGPEPHRMKDIGDYITTQQVLIESRKKGMFSLLRAPGTGKAEMHLEDFRKAWGKESAMPKDVKMLLQSPATSKGTDLPSLSPGISRSAKVSMPSYPSTASISVSPSVSPFRNLYSKSPYGMSLPMIMSLPSRSPSEKSANRLLSPSLYREGDSHLHAPIFLTRYKFEYPRKKYPFLMKFPDVIIHRDEGGKSSFIRPSRRYRYTPDIGSVMLGIKAKIPRAVLESRFPAIGQRPIPLMGRTRRKKKGKDIISFRL